MPSLFRAVPSSNEADNLRAVGTAARFAAGSSSLDEQLQDSYGSSLDTLRQHVTSVMDDTQRQLDTQQQATATALQGAVTQQLDALPAPKVTLPDKEYEAGKQRQADWMAPAGPPLSTPKRSSGGGGGGGGFSGPVPAQDTPYGPDTVDYGNPDTLKQQNVVGAAGNALGSAFQAGDAAAQAQGTGLRTVAQMQQAAASAAPPKEMNLPERVAYGAGQVLNPSGAAATIAPIVEGVQGSSQGIAGLAGHIMPKGAANAVGAVGGALSLPGEVMKETARRALSDLHAPEGVTAVGSEVASALAPSGFVGDSFGAVNKARLLATGLGAAGGTAAGYALGDPNAPGGLVGEAVKGGAMGLQAGAPAFDLLEGGAKLAGKAAGALRGPLGRGAQAAEGAINRLAGESWADYAARARRLGITPDAFGVNPINEAADAAGDLAAKAPWQMTREALDDEAARYAAEVKVARLDEALKMGLFTGPEDRAVLEKLLAEARAERQQVEQGAARAIPPAPAPAPSPPVSATSATPPPPSASGPGANAPKPTPGESLDRIMEMYAKGQAPPPPSTEIEAAINHWTNVGARALFDQGAGLQKAQQMVYDRLGRAPTAAEDVYTLFRLNAGRGEAAAQRVREGLGPVLQSLTGNDEEVLNAYLTAMDNADVAAHIGRRVVRDTLGKPLPPTAGRAALQRGEQSLRMRQANAATVAQRHAAAEQAVAAAQREAASLQRQVVAARKLAKRADPDLAAEGAARVPFLLAQRQAAIEAMREAKAAARETSAAVSTAGRRIKSAETRLGRITAAIDARVAEATAQRQQEALKAGALAQEGRAFSGGAAGHTPEEVNQALIDKVGPEQAQRVQAAAQGVWDFTKALRQRLHESGGIDAATLAEWEQAFPHYVKTDVLKYMPEHGTAPGVGQVAGARKLSMTDLGIERLTTEGTLAARDKPLNSVIRQAFGVETQAQKNAMANGIVTMAERDPELKQLFRPVLSQREAAARGLKPGEFVPQDYTLANDEFRFGAIKDGQVQEYVLPNSLKPLVSIDPAQVPEWVRWLATASGAPLLRATATTLNSRFLPTNAIRDALVYARRATGGIGASPYAAAKEFGRAYRDVFSHRDTASIADVAAIRRGGGAQSSGISGSKPEAILRTLRRDSKLGGLIRPIESKADYLGVVGDVLSLPLRATVGAVGERIEQAPRLAAYRLAKRMGLSEQQSLLWARDISMDFSRGGTFAKVANVLVPFFNVGMQAPERLLTLDLAKGKRLQNALAIGGTAVLPLAVAEAWNQSQYPDDYANVPDYLKNRGLVLMLPVEAPPQEDGSKAQRPYLWFPTDPSLSFLNTAIREAATAATKGDAVRWEEMLASVVGSVSPVPPEAGGALSSLLPPALQQTAEQTANYDFYRGRQIVPESLKNLPPEYQTQPGVSPLSNALAGGASAISRKLGGPGVSPVRTDYALRSLAPGVMNAIGVGGRPSSSQTLPVLNTPGLGGLVAPFLRQAGGQGGEDARKRLDTERDAEIRSIMAEIESDPSWRQYTPEEQATVRRAIANKITAQYDKLRKADALTRKWAS